jgi:hypothetical protein
MWMNKTTYAKHFTKPMLELFSSLRVDGRKVQGFFEATRPYPCQEQDVLDRGLSLTFLHEKEIFFANTYGRMTATRVRIQIPEHARGTV